MGIQKEEGGNFEEKVISINVGIFECAIIICKVVKS